MFKAHYNTILRLKSYFPFSLIDAMGTLEECRSQIVRELRYQSSLDLDERTYAAIRCAGAAVLGIPWPPAATAAYSPPSCRAPPAHRAAGQGGRCHGACLRGCAHR